MSTAKPGAISSEAALVQSASRSDALIPLVPLIAIGVIVVLALMAFAADILAPYSPTETALTLRLLPPLSPGHLLGTDGLGRDILSRVIHGSRVSLSVMAVSIFVGGGVGTALGILSGYRGGWTDALIMRMGDIMLGFPLMIFAILFAAVYGSSFTSVVVILALGMWARFARIARGETLSLKEKEFVAAARVAGAPTVQVILRHIVPHLANSLMTIASLQAAWAVIVEASLSFFGVGVPPPSPSWGGMVSDGREFVTSAWWVAFFPGVAIALLVLSLNLLGDWLRDHLDPSLRQSR